MIVSICSMIKDPYPPYLMEWLHHHRDLGVDKFFIYDNDSSFPISKIIERCEFKEDIKVFGVPGIYMQLPIYARCIKEFKSGELPFCNWVAFIDEDEFIICENEDIKATLEEYNGYPGLGISWRVYGSSGVKTRSPIPQKEKFIYPTSPKFYMNRNVKSIVNPFKVSEPRKNPHSFNYIEGFCVNVDFKPFKGRRSRGAFLRYPIHRKIWINHYETRSQEEWEEKARRQLATGVAHYPNLPAEFTRDPNWIIEIDKDSELYRKTI